MTFGHKSDVQNHFSSKHPLFPHKLTIADDAPDNVIEPVRDAEPPVAIPVSRVEETAIHSS
jgi:hypothetical protein